MDGDEAGLVLGIGNVDPKKVDFKMRIKAVLIEERGVDICEVKYFKPT